MTPVRTMKNEMKRTISTTNPKHSFYKIDLSDKEVMNTLFKTEKGL